MTGDNSPQSVAHALLSCVDGLSRHVQLFATEAERSKAVKFWNGDDHPGGRIGTGCTVQPECKWDHVLIALDMKHT